MVISSKQTFRPSGSQNNSRLSLLHVSKTGPYLVTYPNLGGYRSQNLSWMSELSCSRGWQSASLGIFSLTICASSAIASGPALRIVFSMSTRQIEFQRQL